jgi:cyclophilin family peptidyl-prolyl cis-trans isomerase
MLRLLLTVGLTAALALTGATTFGAQAPKPAAAPVVVLETTKGTIEIETLPADAPKSVARFIELATRAFYRGHRFHWVQPHLVQTGDPLSRDMTKRAKWGTGGSGPSFALRPIGVAEMSKRSFARGLVGLAYVTGAKPESADSQFFILKVDNSTLNGKYAAIGRVSRGMAVVDRLDETDSIKAVTVK